MARISGTRMNKALIMRAYLLLAALLTIHATATDITVTTSLSAIQHIDIPTFVTLTLYRAHAQLSLSNATSTNSSGLVATTINTSAPSASTGGYPLCNSTLETALNRTYAPTYAAPTASIVEGLGTSDGSKKCVENGWLGLVIVMGVLIGSAGQF